MIKKYLYLTEDNITERDTLRKRLKDNGIEHEEKYYPCDNRRISALPVFIIDYNDREWKRFEQRESPLDIDAIKEALETFESIIQGDIQTKVQEEKAKDLIKQQKEDRIKVLKAKGDLTTGELVELLKLEGII